MTRDVHAPVFLSHLGIVNALGCGKAAVSESLMHGSQKGMVQQSDWLIDNTSIHVGKAEADTLSPEMLGALSRYYCRGTELLLKALEEIEEDVRNAISRVGPARVAIVLGSSTVAVDQAEKDFQLEPSEINIYKYEHNLLSDFLASYFEITGLSYTITTACSSSSHALAAARRLLNVGLADIVLAGGVDSLCGLTLNGFYSLSLLSEDICNPFSKNRDGINIGEGAALFLIQREEAAIAIVGAGYSSDAHSMTAPDPKGEGIQAAIYEALKGASLRPEDIDYIHLHGTGTLQNDQVESVAIKSIFKSPPLYSSSKSQIGHTLGAAGAMGVAHAWLSLLHEKKHLPPHIWDGQADGDLLTDNFVPIGQSFEAQHPIFLINAFAFGGNNVSLIVRGDT